MMRRTRRIGRLETNPVDRIITEWENSPFIKSPLGLKREVRDPQKGDARAAAKLVAPMIKPTHIRVSCEENVLML
jgi:hypothetical protein